MLAGETRVTPPVDRWEGAVLRAAKLTSPQPALLLLHPSNGPPVAQVLNLTTALNATRMWANTLFVWTNDNGSPVTVGGSHHPLRGGKGSNWEGVRAAATLENL